MATESRGAASRRQWAAGIMARVADASTILLVDDEDSVQKLLTYPLERDGFRVVPAHDGEEALLRFAEQPVDLVVLDLMLPKLDGLEVCKRLRLQSSVPIIMLTARDDEFDKVLGLELGADDYITKPFSIREFRSRVRALLRRVSSPRQADGRELDDRGRRGADRPRATDGGGRRAARSSSRTSSSSSCARSPPAPGSSSRGSACSRRSGAARTTASPGRSTSTSATCGRSWSPIPASRATCRPCAASATASRREPVPERRRTAEPRAGRWSSRRRSRSSTPASSRSSSGTSSTRRSTSSCRSGRSLGGAGVHPIRRLADLRGGKRPERERPGDDRRRDRAARAPAGGLAVHVAPRRSTTRSRVRAARTTRPRAGGWSATASPMPRSRSRSRRASCSCLRAPLEDTLSNVELVQRRLLLAGAVALLLSLALGYGAAYLFARRIRRLERAADRIASGRFDEPVVDRGRDEVGQLAAAFDRMRLRLAGLDRARREFIANASHELRTPIFSLGGFLELLDDEDLDEETRQEFLGTAARAGDAAREARDRPARPLAPRRRPGRSSSARRSTSARLASSICREFEAVARSKRPPDRDGAATAQRRPSATSSERSRSAAILVENALLHTPPRDDVSASGPAARTDGRCSRSRTRGRGSAATQAAHVFDRFYRVDGGVTHRAAGWGWRSRKSSPS